MEIRYANLEDLKQLVQVEAECFPVAEAAGCESIKARLLAFPECFWVLEDEGRIVSFINGMATDETILRDEMFDNAGLHKKDGAWQMIFGVDTISEYRCRGCAALVMERVIEDSKERGRKGLVLTCKEHMLHYYAKFGFVNKGISASEHGGAEWYDMVLEF